MVLMRSGRKVLAPADLVAVSGVVVVALCAPLHLWAGLEGIPRLSVGGWVAVGFLGIFGSEGDAQCEAVRAMQQQRGAEVVLVDSQALNAGEDHAFDGELFQYRGRCLNDVRCWYLRHIMSPLPPKCLPQLTAEQISEMKRGARALSAADS